MGPPATRAARPARPSERDRLQSSVPRQRLDRRKKGGAATGPNPTDRGKPGTTRHILTDAKSIPLALMLTGANVHDSRMLEAVVDTVPPIRSCWGPPRKRPVKLHAEGLRPPPLSSGADPPPHPAPHRPARDREQPAAGTSQVGRRAHAGVVCPVPSPRHPLRATTRHPSRLLNAGRSPHRLALHRTMVLLGALKCERHPS